MWERFLDAHGGVGAYAIYSAEVSCLSADPDAYRPGVE